MTDIHPDAFDIAAVVARQVHARYRNWTELDDVRQEMLAFLVRNTEKVNGWLNDDEPQAERKHGASALALSLRRCGERYARKEKATRSGYRPEDEYYYESARLEAVLPAVFDHEQWTFATPEQSSEVKSMSDPAHGGNLMAMMVDVRSALATLDKQDKVLLWELYAERRTQDEVAGRHELTQQAVSKRHQKALAHLVEALGGPSPWVRGEHLGSRRVMSNATAAAITHNQYED